MQRSRRLFLFIVFLTVLSIFTALPRQLKIDTQILGKKVKIDRVLPGLSFFGFERDLELKQGLDIKGGTQVVLEADMSQIEPDDRSTALESARNIISRRVDLYGVAEAGIKTSVNQDQYRLVVELPGIDQPQEALDLIGQTARLEFATPVFDPNATSSAEAQIIGFSATDLTGADLRLSQVTFETQDRQPAVSLKFRDEGKDKFAQLTREYLNYPLAITLDGDIVTTPVVQTEILTGEAIITGDFSLEEAQQLAIQLNAGALPVPIKVLSQKNVPATLGQQAVTQSLTAGGIGLALVIMFMSVYYGWLGIIASFGLILYGLFTLALYKLIPVTITIPGIAGFLLSVGMAVDSNILIFERYKEEIRAGRRWRVALELGFGRAWDSIKDANIATLITGTILFNPLDFNFLNTSGAVRGFALTLILGIFISLFTGIVVTRTFLRLFYHPREKSISNKGK